MNPLVSIVIVNWNTSEYLKTCLDYLKKQSEKYFEIIIVDNNSNDKNIEVLNNINMKLYTLKTNIDTYKNNMRECKKLEVFENNYRMYSKLVCRNGLPYMLLQNIVNKIERISNKILTNITNFTIEITQIYNNNSKSKDKKLRSRSSIEIYKIESNMKKIKIQSCSGFERFIVGLVLRLAIIKSSQLQSPNFMAIDEGFSCMDKSNLENIDSLFNIIKSTFDFALIVSHINELKDKCDNYINITKQNENSPSYVYF